MKKTFKVRWMHCKSCELLIDQKITELWDACTACSISHKSNTVSVTIWSKKDEKKVRKAIRDAWYSLDDEEGTSNNSSNSTGSSSLSLQDKICVLIGVWLVLFLLFTFDLNWLMPQYTSLTWGVALLIWLVASVSTCLAVTWWIIIWYAETVEDTSPFMTQLWFHVWRIAAFVIGWWLLWMIWGELAWNIWISAVLNILMGIVLLWLWLKLLGMFPRWWVWIHRPAWIGKKALAIKNPRYSRLVWALTFFLPCWFTQSMQLFAIQSWDPLQGAMLMGLFALGTLPVLFGLWWGTEYIKKHISYLNPVIAWLLVVFGIFTLYNWWNLAGSLWNNDFIVSETQNEQDVDDPVETVRLEVWHNWWQFIPETITLEEWARYEIAVTPESDWIWCMATLARWWRNIPIRQWEEFILEVDASRTGSIPLVCWSMWMRQWEIRVE